MFVHGGWAHLLGNMLFLLAFGPFLEDVYGRPLFALLYLGSGVVWGLAVNAGCPGSFATSFGASGAISGVMGAFLVRFATRRLNLLSIPALWLPMVRVRVSVPTCGYLLFWLATNIRGVWLGIPGIAWGAHILGFAFGVLFAGVLKLTRIEEHLIDPLIEASLTLIQHPAVGRAFACRLAGRPEAAHRVIKAALAEAPENLDVLREAYDDAVAAGYLAQAGAHATRLVARLGAQSGPDGVAEMVCFVEEARATLGAALPTRFYLVAGDCLERHGQKAQALLLYEGLANHPDAQTAQRATARQARVLRELGSVAG
jgi:hypothetical protein